LGLSLSGRHVTSGAERTGNGQCSSGSRCKLRSNSNSSTKLRNAVQLSELSTKPQRKDAI
jgi:hypothetical protein